MSPPRWRPSPPRRPSARFRSSSAAGLLAVAALASPCCTRPAAATGGSGVGGSGGGSGYGAMGQPAAQPPTVPVVAAAEALGAPGSAVAGVPAGGAAAAVIGEPPAGLPVESPGAVAAPSFCNGMPTAMHMQGFVSVFGADREEQPCAVFLLPWLVLDTPLRFATGCLGAALAGLLTEAASAARRAAEKGGAQNWLAQTMLHGLVLSLGYTDMLLVMVYNLELAASVVLGLCAGRLLFSVLGGGPGGGSGGLKRLVAPLAGGGGGGDFGTTPCCAAE